MYYPLLTIDSSIFFPLNFTCQVGSTYLQLNISVSLLWFLTCLVQFLITYFWLNESLQTITVFTNQTCKFWHYWKTSSGLYTCHNIYDTVLSTSIISPQVNKKMLLFPQTITIIINLSIWILITEYDYFLVLFLSWDVLLSGNMNTNFYVNRFSIYH